MKILYHGRTRKEDQEKCLGKDWRDSTTTYGFLTVLLRWLNTVSRAVSGKSHDGACFKLDKQTWQRKRQWYIEDNFSKSTH